MGKLRVCNLYAGIGGNRKLWGDEHDITAVEWDEETAKVYQDYFPEDEIIIADAHQYLLDNYREFDFIWASPPCPTHSKIRLCGTFRGQNKAVYPDITLYQEIIFLQYHTTESQKWVVENVHPYYPPLVPYTKKINRHLYWSNFKIGSFDIGIKYDDVRNSIPKMESMIGIEVSDSGIQNKLKSIRNCVHPEIGKYILDRAQDIIVKSDTEQVALEL